MTTARVPLTARKDMQDAIWRDCVQPGDNEWTTFSDSAILAETAARALESHGWTVITVEEIETLRRGLYESHVAQNPGIDENEVRASVARTSGLPEDYWETAE